MGTFSVWHWIIVLVIVLLIFGTKKLRNIGPDLGSAIKGFKEGMKEGSQPTADSTATQRIKEHVLEAEASEVKEKNQSKI